MAIIRPAGNALAVPVRKAPQIVSITLVVPPAIRIVASANIAASGEATSLSGMGAGFTAPSGKSGTDFVAGRRWDDENGTDSLNLAAANKWTVIAWAVAANSAVVATTEQYEFRVVADGAVLDTYSVTPQWTIGTPPAPSSTAARRLRMGLGRLLQF